MDLSAQVAGFLHRHGLEGSAGVVAVSGGPDSVALAHLLFELLRARKLEKLIFAHVNHQLRAAESDGDEQFVQHLPSLLHMADEPRLICKTTRIDVAAIAGRERDNLESTARRERYAWLAQVARAEGAVWVATGHTADDQAETVLFRLLRGSGVHGLGGMSERRPLQDGVTLIRPLLAVRRHVLRDYLGDRRLPSCVDSSNRDLSYTRNRLRAELLPMLEKQFNPAVVEVLCRLADQAQELNAATVVQADQLLQDAELPRAGDMLVFSVNRLQQASANLVREMFRRVWQRERWPAGEMDFERWNRLADIVAGMPTAWDFPGGIHVRRTASVLQIQKVGLS